MDERQARFEERLNAFEEKLDAILAIRTQVEGSSSDIRLHTSKLQDHDRAISGAHKAIKDMQEYVATAKGGMKVLYIVIILSGGFIGTMLGLGVKIMLAQNDMLARHDQLLITHQQAIEHLLEEKK